MSTAQKQGLVLGTKFFKNEGLLLSWRRDGLVYTPCIALMPALKAREQAVINITAPAPRAFFRDPANVEGAIWWDRKKGLVGDWEMVSRRHQDTPESPALLKSKAPLVLQDAQHTLQNQPVRVVRVPSPVARKPLYVEVGSHLWSLYTTGHHQYGVFLRDYIGDWIDANAYGVCMATTPRSLVQGAYSNQPVLITRPGTDPVTLRRGSDYSGLVALVMPGYPAPDQQIPTPQEILRLAEEQKRQREGLKNRANPVL